MPFVSKAQQGFLEVHNKKVASEFAKHTKNYKKLPYHVKKTKSHSP